MNEAVPKRHASRAQGGTGTALLFLLFLFLFAEAWIHVLLSSKMQTQDSEFPKPKKAPCLEIRVFFLESRLVRFLN